jgi:hypothetical protein
MAEDEWFVQAGMEIQMRKLILVAALATMWTSSCYANLSLASNTTQAPAATEAPAAAEVKAQPTDVTARKVSEPEAPVSEARRATVAKSASRPRRIFSNRARVFRASFYQHCL